MKTCKNYKKWDNFRGEICDNCKSFAKCVKSKGEKDSINKELEFLYSSVDTMMDKKEALKFTIVFVNSSKYKKEIVEFMKKNTRKSNSEIIGKLKCSNTHLVT